MGTYVEFWVGAVDGIRGHFLNSDLADFKLWFEVYNNDYVNDEELRQEDVAPIYALISKVTDHDYSCLTPISAREAYLIDRMIDIFYGFYCDTEQHQLMVRAEESMLRIYRYEQSSELLKTIFNADGMRYWQYILNGRGIGRDNELYFYRSSNNIYKTCYLTYQECIDLHKIFSDTFKLAELEEFGRHDIYCAIYRTFAALNNILKQETGLIITVA